MTPQKYELYLTRSQKGALWLPAIMFVLFPVIFLLMFQLMPQTHPPGETMPPFFPWFPLGLFMLLGLVMFSPVLTLHRTIDVTSNNTLVFTSYLRTVEVRANEVLSVEAASFRWARVPLTIYVMNHRGGKVRFPCQFTGQHQLLSELKQFNPSVEMKGC